MDIRLKTAKFTLGNEEYDICCNMNVLADVQEMHGGNLGAALDSAGTLRTTLCFLTAMINDARDTQGLEPYSVKEVGRKVACGSMRYVRETVMRLVTMALISDEAAKADETEEEEKNL